MNNKKVLSMMMAVALAVTPFTAVMAKEEKLDVEPISEELEKVESKYQKYSGQVINIGDNKDELLYVTIAKDKNNELGDLLIKLPEDALIYKGDKAEKAKREDIKKGDLLDVFLDEETPMTLSIPGQTIPQVVVINNPVDGKMGKITKADRFNSELVSRDGSLKLNIGKETEILDTKGKKLLEKDLVDRDLLVFFDVTTKSIPAQTTPSKVIVLGDLTDKVSDFTSLYVNGEKLRLEKAMYIKDGNYMLPLREVAEKLGYEIKWNGKNRSIELTQGPVWSTMKIGDKNYGFAKMLVTLDQAPVLNGANTYVPANYFDEVLQLNVAMVDGVLNIAR